jgi:hypothetical protein
MWCWIVWTPNLFGGVSFSLTDQIDQIFLSFLFGKGKSLYICTKSPFCFSSDPNTAVFRIDQPKWAVSSFHPQAVFHLSVQVVHSRRRNHRKPAWLGNWELSQSYTVKELFKRAHRLRPFPHAHCTFSLTHLDD